MCEKLHGMMYTYIRDHRRVSESFSAPLNARLPGQAFPFSLGQNPEPFQIISFGLQTHPQPQKTFLQTFPFKEGVLSWSTPNTSNHSSVRQQSEGRSCYTSRVNTDLSQSKYSMYVYVCMCVYISLCMLIVHLDDVTCR